MLTPETLQTELLKFHPHLDEFFQNRLQLTPPNEKGEVVKAAEYLTPNYLQTHLEAFATQQRIPDLAIAASLWNKYYNNALIPAILIPMTLLGIGLEASLENVSLILKDGKPEAIFLHSLDSAISYSPRFGQDTTADLPTVSSLSELHTFVFTPLLHHLTHLIKQINTLTCLPPSVMWGNGGNLCAYLYQELSHCPGGTSSSQEDQAAIFHQRNSPTGNGRNPLYRTMIFKDSEPFTLRRICCLLFRIPAGEGYCGNCPLIQEQPLACLK
jgi:ferric iron reductase protein FhuF